MGEDLDRNPFGDREKLYQKWLPVLLENYNHGESKTEHLLQGYTLAFNGLSEERVERAIRATLKNHRSSFLPTPGEVLGYLAEAERLPESERSPAIENNCQKCRGTGYAMVVVDGANFAARCACRKPKAKGTAA